MKKVFHVDTILWEYISETVNIQFMTKQGGNEHPPFSIHLCAICDIIPFLFGNTPYRRGIFINVKKTRCFVCVCYIFLLSLQKIQQIEIKRNQEIINHHKNIALWKPRNTPHRNLLARGRGERKQHGRAAGCC